VVEHCEVVDGHDRRRLSRREGPARQWQVQHVGAAAGGFGARTARCPCQIEPQRQHAPHRRARRWRRAHADAQQIHVGAVGKRIGELQRGARHASLAEARGGEVERDPQRACAHA
jgi:hypothetical protein